MQSAMVTAARLQLPLEDLDLYSRGPPGLRFVMSVVLSRKILNTKLGCTYKPWTSLSFSDFVTSVLVLGPCE